MAAIAEVFRRIVVRSGDTNLLDHGGITTPQQPNGTAITGKPVVKPKTESLAAGASKKIWDYTADGSFSLFFIECSGFAWLSTKVDAPTSTTDFTAAGTSVNYPKDAISCVAPHIIDSILCPVAASSSNYAGSAFHASVATGRRYEIWVKNPSSTDAIDITFGWAL
jgi:hypothetical protein